jgi:hypothetical protein
MVFFKAGAAGLLAYLGIGHSLAAGQRCQRLVGREAKRSQRGLGGTRRRGCGLRRLWRRHRLLARRALMASSG